MKKLVLAILLALGLAACGDDRPSKPGLIRDNDRVRESERNAWDKLRSR